MNGPLLACEKLGLTRGDALLFSEIHLTLQRGQTAVVEGGNRSGKSSLIRALCRDAGDALALSGSLRFRGSEVLTLPERSYRETFLKHLSFVTENAGEALLPAERVRRLFACSQVDSTERQQTELLAALGFAAPEALLERRVADLSRGTRFGVALALALSREPELLVLDDVLHTCDLLGSEQWFGHIRRLQDARGLAVLVLARSAGSYGSLRPQQVVPLGEHRALPTPSERAFAALVSTRSGDQVESRKPMIRVEQLTVLFGRHPRRASSAGTLCAVHSLDLNLWRGELLALTGASPSGKTVLGLTLARLLEPTFGRVSLRVKTRDLNRSHKKVLLCLDDAPGSLDPRWTLGEQLAEAARLGHGENSDTAELSALAFEAVGLEPRLLEARRDQLSQGETELATLARVLLLDPEVLIVDGSLGSVQPSHRSLLLTLLAKRCAERALGMLLISHDPALAGQIAHRLAIMYAGRVVEVGPSTDVLAVQHHPYTRRLLRTARQRQLQLLDESAAPNPEQPPAGCPFYPHCPRFEPGRCDENEPPLLPIAERGGHLVACWHPHV